VVISFDREEERERVGEGRIKRHKAHFLSVKLYSQKQCPPTLLAIFPGLTGLNVSPVIDRV